MDRHRINRRGTIAGMSVLAAAAATAFPAQTSGAAGMLKAVGNRLVYNGSPVRLRGVAPGDPFLARRRRTLADYNTISGSWRSNVVRISVHPGTWRDHRTEALKRLRQDVAAALANRMWVVIDWHVIGWPTNRPGMLDTNGSYEVIAEPSWNLGTRPYDARWDLARSFWQEMSIIYRGEPRVAFELWNEPAYNPANEDWLPGRGWPDLKASYEELLVLIRGNGSGNLAVLGGLRWAYDLRGIKNSPVYDPAGNVAYAWHVYAGNDNNDKGLWAHKLDGLNLIYPVLVTEWGFCRTCDGAHYLGTPEDFGRPFLQDFLEGRKLSWIAWCWHPYWGPPMLQPDWTTPNELGRLVMGSLKQGVHPRP